MVQPTQDRQRDHLTTTQIWWNRRSKWLRDLLFDALMRSHVIKVLHVGLEHSIHVFLMEDKDVIKTFVAYAPQKAFTDGIGTRCVIRGLEELDGACCGYPCESWSEFTIVIVNEVSGYFPIRRSLSQLLCDPCIGRSFRDSYMDHFTRFQLDDEEGKQRTEEEVGDL